MRFLKDRFDSVSASFEREVRERAAELVRIGECAPFDAIDKARQQVMAARRAEARQKLTAALAVAEAKGSRRDERQ